MQDRVIDLAVSVLELVRQHIEDMLALKTLRDQALDVRQPPGRIAHRRRGPGIAPAVAVHVPVHSCEDRLASGVGDALQCPGALGLAVLVVADRSAYLRLAVAVNGFTGDVSIDRVE